MTERQMKITYDKEGKPEAWLFLNPDGSWDEYLSDPFQGPQPIRDWFREHGEGVFEVTLCTFPVWLAVLIALFT